MSDVETKRIHDKEGELFKPNPRVISFIGADGAGKSTIATHFHDELSRLLPNQQVVLINGTNYPKWDFSFRTRMAKIDPHAGATLQGLYSRDEAAMSLAKRFNRIRSVACYLHAEKLVENGSIVVIDSDPAFKYISWNLLRGYDLSGLYTDLSKRVHKVAHGLFPGTILHIMPTGDIEADKSIIWDRLSGRVESGEKLSPYDPTNPDEVEERLKSYNTVEAFLRQTLPGLRIEPVTNPDASRETIDYGQIDSIAQDISSRLSSQSASSFSGNF